ncbi:myosin-VIIa-like [Anneissia japonica]|uniref:myosin-VIIa-like n=1 Tax=Anneissia japonica TaxID=1529436 RepID=UPI0014258576|nr:myosin-VIIa-like [Anneissia japonica]
MVVLTRGDYVWLEDPRKKNKTSGDVPIGARVKIADSGQLQLQDDEGKDHWISSDVAQKLRTMHITSIEGVDDMIRLGDLHEAGILRNLLVRYQNNVIYTFTGSILVAVNPYQILPIYTGQQIREYRDKKIGEEPPHIFAIADNAYCRMLREVHNQCVIIRCGKCLTCEGRDDIKDFADIRSAMKVLNFNDGHIYELLKLLAAILEFGNIEYDAIETSNLEAVCFRGHKQTEAISKILKVNLDALENALSTKKTVAAGEVVVSPVNKAKAIDMRDAFVKAIYGRMFIWVVGKVNDATFQAKSNANDIRVSIGVLDIFGFENFGKNSFEQMCINYANENLQQFFVQHIFKLEQDEYEREGIQWQHIQFVDNQETLDMIAVKPLNILALVDEESRFPRGTDKTMLQKLNQQHGTNPLYMKARSTTGTQFGIKHFAGQVFYETIGFLDKNRDTFSPDFLELIQKGGNSFLKMLFKADLDINRNQRKSALGAKSTLGAQFKKSLDSLMKTLNSCQPFFVRCIKPNEFKKPSTFERDLVVRQLRYSGMMETISIRRAGYPIRHTFYEFVGRYRILGTGIKPANKENCKAASKKICNDMLGAQDWQLGHQKVFLKDAHDLLLEQARDRAQAEKCIIIQRVVRGWYYRKRYIAMRKSAIYIQSCWRKYAQRVRFTKMRKGFLRLQAYFRTRTLSYKFHFLRYRIGLFQAYCRGYIVRREHRKYIGSIVKIQSVFRMLLARNRYLKIRNEQRRRKKAEKYRKEIELQLKKEMGQKKAKEEAQRLMQEKLKELEEIDADAELQRKRELLDNMEEIKRAEKIRIELPVEVEEAFKSGPTTSNQEQTDSKEDLSNYTFAKFATTYFQGGATATYVRKKLTDSLLDLKNKGDRNDGKSVMSKIYSTLGRTRGQKELPQMPDDANPLSGSQKKSTIRKKLISLTIKRKSVPRDVAERIRDGEEIDINHSMIIDRPTSNLEKLHFIIGHGILRPNLRDEIYCMICKQLSGNNAKGSHARGWILLSLCVGCFAPTDRFVKYLRCFISEGPPGYAPYCEERLQRTFENGTRNQPPSWLELQATKSKKPIMLPITYMDGTTKTLLADSAATARELCQMLAEKVGLKDQFGFSIYIAIFDKVTSLGSGGDHVMDAISQCEQYAKEQGAQERNAPWRLFFRKEIFAPWHDAREDPVGTNLIYHQVVRGIKFGEYKCDQVSNHSSLCHNIYKCTLSQCLTGGECHDRGLMSPAKEMMSSNKRANVADKTGELPGQSFTLVTVSGDEFTFTSSNAEDIREHIGTFHEGLKKKSRFVVSLRDNPNQGEGSSLLSFQKGDLIILEHEYNESIMDGRWCYGVNDRTGLKGDFSADCVYVLPALTKPSPEIVSFFTMDRSELSQKFMSASENAIGSHDTLEKPHTLEEFAIEHFRSPQKQTLSKAVKSLRGRPQDELWSHSREPIRQPLLKKLIGNDELARQSTEAFLAIMKYMGDYPTRKDYRHGNELTDQIFEGALKNEPLRDEIFCQIVKQLTSNKIKFSEERGWELMWLMTGIFACSKALHPHVTKFLRSKRHQLAMDCIHRLQKTIQYGQRKNPPHLVEVEAIIHKTTQIFHKVYFPDDTDEAFEVESGTRAKDFTQNISKRLHLRSAEGFSLFVKIADKVISVPECDFFFDFVRHLTDLIRKARPSRDGTMPTYKVFFMKKLWTNTVPGNDPNADCIFHYHQELPKLLRGYHKCSKDEGAQLAALQYRVRFGDDKSEFQNIPRFIKDFLPADLIRQQSTEFWKRMIVVAYNKHSEKSRNEAKVAFLKIIYRWPTFGSAFFEVRQTTEPTYPEVLLIGINKLGVNLIDPKSKEILATYPFTKISNWSSGNTYFHMTIGNLVRGTKLLCETPLGYKMDDLLTSYISQMLTNMNKQKSTAKFT